jgi:hypothetical protein
VATFGISVGIDVGTAVGVGAIELHAAVTVNIDKVTIVSRHILMLFILKTLLPFPFI